MGFLKGYFSYLTAIGGAITAIGMFINGDISLAELVSALWAVAALFGVRRAVGTTHIIAAGSLPSATVAQKAEAKEAAPKPKPHDE